MRIGIDCRLWNETGVGRYIRNLVYNLQEIDKKNEYVLFMRSDDADKLKLQASSFQFRIVKTDIRWHTIDEQLKLPQILNNESLDLVHFPYFSVPIFYNRQYVITVHDLIVGKFPTGKASTLPYPSYLVKKMGYNLVLSNAVHKALKIIVPSNAVKDDLLNKYKDIDSNKVIITYEGGLENMGGKEKPVVSGKYFLRVGNFYSHKNVQAVIMAFSSLVYKHGIKDMKLVLVGKKDYFYSRIEKIIIKNNLRDSIIFFDNPDDKTLISLYQNAKATIVPSFMEGFSLTAIEAMSLGCLVLASDIAVHREICKDAAIYFDPYSIEDMKNKMEEVLNDSNHLTENIEKGLERVKLFSWQKMARQTLKVYEKSTVLA